MPAINLQLFSRLLIGQILSHIMTLYQRILIALSVFVVFSFFYACSPMRQFADLSTEADEAWESGDYAESYKLYGQLIEAHRSRDQAIDGEVYNRAGISAYEAGETQQALEYLEFSRHTDAADDRTFASLAKAYRDIDNLSREITNLERYIERYPDGTEADAFRERLFETLVESMNLQQALDLWNDLPGNPYQDESLLTLYLQLNRQLDNNVKAADLAEQLLDQNRNNQEALDFLARKHLQEAISRYNREMRAYDENRTHRQYAQLLEALEVVNTDLRISLNYFKRLYDQDPRPEYAGFMADIYERFQDEENARYYRRRAD